MKRTVVTALSCLLIVGLSACDKSKDEAKSEDKAEAKTEDKAEDKAETAKADDKAAKAEGDEAAPKQDANKAADAPVDDTKGIGGVVHAAAGDEKAPEAAAAGEPAPGAEAAAPAEPAAPAADAPHFDVSKDKGSLIGHLASAVAHDDALADAEAAAELAKLAGEDLDAGPTDGELCAHVWTDIFKKEFADAATDEMEAEFMKMCEEEVAKERIKLGPDVFAQDAACIMASTTLADLELCDQAEQEAEEALHANPHGDGVDRPTCEAAVDHIFKLISADLSDEQKAIMEAFEEDMKVIHEDAVLACMDEATKAELECAMKAETLEALESCE